MTDVPLAAGADNSPATARELPLWLPRVQLTMSLIAGALLLIGFVGVVMVDVAPLFALYYASLAIGMIYGVRAALIALAEKRVDIDVLMVVGAVLAAAVDHPEEGALLLVLFTFAGALEALAMERTQREIRALRDLMPDWTTVLRDGEWVGARPDELTVGDQIRVRPGDRVPVDAVVLEGSTSLDEATLTGESVPRSVSPGDDIFAGTINGEAALRARVARLAKDSSVQRVLAMVVDAREQREPLQRAIDRIGQPYTIGVMAFSLAVFLVWWLAFADSPTDAAYVAITFLIVASPCALVIATPTATLAAIARGARAGVLFKGGESIDRLSRTGAACFDKTGTLTKGRPVFKEILACDGVDPDVALAVAAALERDSTHPTAKAIVAAAHSHERVESVRSEAGRGMSGRWNGREVRVGNLAFVSGVMQEERVGHVRETLASVREQGNLGVAFAAAGDDCACAVIVLRDETREGGGQLVRELHELGVRPVRMLTGDHEIVARRIADELELDGFAASLLPEQKVAAVEELKKQRAGGPRPAVAVIGDGVNDAPALAAADVSIAVGSIGSDAALETADIVLLSEDLSRVPWALRLARATRRTVAANITVALAIIGVMGLVVLIGSRTGYTVPLAVGVLAHEGGTVAVVLNSLRLLFFGDRA